MNIKFGFINLTSRIHNIDCKPQSGLKECFIGCSSGTLYWQKWNNMHFVLSASFLLTIYFDYLTGACKNLQCCGGTVQPSELLSFTQS